MGCFDGHVEWIVQADYYALATNYPPNVRNRLWCNPGNPTGH